MENPILIRFQTQLVQFSIFTTKSLEIILTNEQWGFIAFVDFEWKMIEIDSECNTWAVTTVSNMRPNVERKWYNEIESNLNIYFNNKFAKLNNGNVCNRCVYTLHMYLHLLDNVNLYGLLINSITHSKPKYDRMFKGDSSFYIVLNFVQICILNFWELIDFVNIMFTRIWNMKYYYVIDVLMFDVFDGHCILLVPKNHIAHIHICTYVIQSFDNSRRTIKHQNRISSCWFTIMIITVMLRLVWMLQCWFRTRYCHLLLFIIIINLWQWSTIKTF